jgi:ArsR family transcriptional regulator
MGDFMESQMTQAGTIPLAYFGLADGHGAQAAPTSLGEGKARELVHLFKLLADETRLRIIYYLMQQNEMNVRTFCRLLRQSQPAVSHHLALLRSAGVIECRRDGKHNFYRLILKKCQAYLDAVFEVDAGKNRSIKLDDALLTYGRDGQAS